jgi:hypothetical protein
MRPFCFGAALALLVIIGSGGCVTTTNACPVTCPASSQSPVGFDLSCGPTDLTSVILSGPCATGDTNPSDYLWNHGAGVSFTSPSPGVCHVTLTFGTGFTYSTDVTFAQFNVPTTPGCPPCPITKIIAPTQGFFTVSNPNDTCVDAGPDGEG